MTKRADISVTPAQQESVQRLFGLYHRVKARGRLKESAIPGLEGLFREIVAIAGVPFAQH